MMQPRDIRRDLEPGLDPAEAAALVEMGERLLAQRPVPAAAFRGDLGRALAAQVGAAGGSATRSAPAHLRLWIGLSGGLGSVLLLVAALSVAGAGPLAA